MRALAITWLATLGGCSQLLGFDDPITRDGNADGCYGPPGWQVCLAEPPAGPLTLQSQIDTDTSNICITARFDGQPASCIVAATTIDVPATTTAVGSRPLVLVATDAITIAGTVDVSSHQSGSPGAGSTATCAAFALMPDRDSNGGGGGAGGSFAKAGGAGGTGNNASAAGGGVELVVTTPGQLRGGCPGQDGGAGNSAHGTGGQAGGAVYLVAGQSITITGAIAASGAGGVGASTSAGGGGGGAGGMIVLSAPVFSTSGARLVANGGGGAAGATTGTGASGGDPDPSMPAASAGGGSATSPAGAGGDGFAGGVDGARGGDGGSNGGGGGGGGGAGFVLADHPLAGANASPAAGIL